jgi:hypothetical protein
MPRFVRNRKDANHGDIKKALEDAGVKVRDLSEAGGGVTDLLTFWKGELRIVEIKNPQRKWSLTKLQAKMRDVWPVHIVETAAEALAVHGIEVEGDNG